MHLDKLNLISDQILNFTVMLHVSSESGRLTREKMAQIYGPVETADIYFCGPKPMREALAKGHPKRRFHFEEFEIRTGIGLQRLGRHIWSKYLKPRVDALSSRK